MVGSPFRKAREAKLMALDRWRVSRKMVDDDVTVLGEELSDLHIDTLASDLDDETRHHYQRALEHYEQAKEKVRSSVSYDDVLAAEQLLADARYHRAVVLALEAGEPLPERREPCFFDPRHGPSMGDVEWTPPAGVARTVPVCAADARRLTGGEAPAIRMIRVGDRYMPVHEAGGLAAAVSASNREQSIAASGIHNMQSMAQAHLKQAQGGVDGANGMILP